MNDMRSANTAANWKVSPDILQAMLAIYLKLSLGKLLNFEKHSIQVERDSI